MLHPCQHVVEPAGSTAKDAIIYGTAHDKIDMRLWKGGVNVASATTNDNKQRTFYNAPQSFHELHGRNVTSAVAGCGQNAMRVNFVDYMEDSDREPAEMLHFIEKM